MNYVVDLGSKRREVCSLLQVAKTLNLPVFVAPLSIASDTTVYIDVYLQNDCDDQPVALLWWLSNAKYTFLNIVNEQNYTNTVNLRIFVP